MISVEENGVLVLVHCLHTLDIRTPISVDFWRENGTPVLARCTWSADRVLEHVATDEQTTETVGSECPAKRLLSPKRLATRLSRRAKLCYDPTVSTVQAVI